MVQVATVVQVHFLALELPYAMNVVQKQNKTKQKTKTNKQTNKQKHIATNDDQSVNI